MSYLAVGSVADEATVAGAGVRADGVEAGGVGVARPVLALVYVDALLRERAGRAVESRAARALVRALRVGAHLVGVARLLQRGALVHVHADRLVDQVEALLAQAGEGALVVDAGGPVPAAAVVHLVRTSYYNLGENLLWETS